MIDGLKKISIFSIFPEEDLNELSEIIEIIEYKTGDKIISEGEEGNATFIVVDGEVEIKKQNRVIGIITSGQPFGEMAVFDDTKRTADAVARQDSKIYRISSENFRKFICDHPGPGINFLFNSLQLLSRRLKATSNHFVTVFETGKIVGGNYTLAEMSEQILNRLIDDINDASGGMVLILNPFTEQYDIAFMKGIEVTSEERAVELIEQAAGKLITDNSNQGAVLGIPVKEENNVLAYIIVEKKGTEMRFTNEEEIIMTTVGNQVGLGILNAYNKQEEEARRRLEMSRMKGY
ncbi:MAG: cyclic nucleotide-binding domain-containing protein [Elusimicrobiota bacterium]